MYQQLTLQNDAPRTSHRWGGVFFFLFSLLHYFKLWVDDDDGHATVMTIFYTHRGHPVSFLEWAGKKIIIHTLFKAGRRLVFRHHHHHHHSRATDYRQGARERLSLIGTTETFSRENSRGDLFLIQLRYKAE